MARGWSPVEERAKAAAEQQKRFADSAVPMLFSKEIRNGYPASLGGGPLVVRFLEQDQTVNSYERHPIKKPSAQYADHYTCLSEIGQDCPACRAGIKSTRKGAYNLIVRNRAVLRKGADGKVVRDGAGNFIIDGHSDQLVVWECSNTTANVLREADHGFKGLMAWDLTLSYTGNDKNPYSVMPADIGAGPTQMSEADMALAAKKFDLDKVFAPPTQQEMTELVMKYGANSGASSQTGNMPSAIPTTTVTNPYLVGANIPSAAFAAAQEPPKTPAA